MRGAGFLLLRTYVEETSFADAVAAGVLGHGANVPDVEAVAVVGLVEETVKDVLVVVDTMAVVSTAST